VDRSYLDRSDVDRSHLDRPDLDECVMELTRARRVRSCAALAAAALLAPLAAALPASAATAAEPGGRYIVRAEPGRLDTVRREVAALGGSVDRTLGIIDAVSATLPAGAASRLQSQRGVREVTPNVPVHLLGTTTSAYSTVGDANSLWNISRLTGANTMWISGYTGAKIDVALIDSGVAPVTGLSDPAKLVHGPDLTPESQNPATANLDTFGHGTHMAGIIAGRDPGADLSAVAYGTDTTSLVGVAPDARIVSVKAADAQGDTDVSQVIAGIDWVVQHAHDPGYNIRVLNLSYGTDSAQPYQLDPLAYAAEQAWKSGIVVVASAGNSGAASGRMVDPAMDPFVLAVGADDTRNSASTNDDVVPDFSSRGDGVRNPDLVAPGVHVQGLRVPGSFVDSSYFATGGIDDRFMRGGGTSQAAAVVSGAVALTLSARPTLTPDQVKALLKGLASPLPVADRQAQGAGLINLRKVKTTTVTSLPQAFLPATGLGTLEGARGSAHLVLNGVTLAGEQDLLGAPFSSAAMAVLEAAQTSWVGGTWNGRTWAGSSWTGTTWTSGIWAGSAWDGRTWAGRTWADGSWDGRTWAGGTWAGRTWAGAGWDGRTWAGRTWADSLWG
jgi:subtilase family protein